MCDAEKLLKHFQQRQLKIEPLRCTASSTCWCNQLSYKFPTHQAFDTCLSPSEMLEQAGTDMTNEDIKYLRSLAHRPFNR